MSEPTEPTLDDVMTDHESEHPDRHAHAKTPKHVDDDDLEARVEHERAVVHDDEQGR